MVSSVYEITQKDIVEVLNVTLLAFLMGRTIKSKETHQVGKLTVDISKNFQRRLSLKNHWLAYDNFLGNVAKCYYVL
jgi:hypothetical protein